MNNMNSVLNGDRFITLKEIRTTAAISWAAPYTGSAECVIPEGTTLVVQYDQVRGARGFSCIPEKYKELEKVIVPAKDRYELKYAGYHFVFLNEDIGQKLKLISRASAIERKRYEFKMRVRGWFEDIFVLQGLYILALYLFIIATLPLRPFVNFYRKKKLAARRTAEEQSR
ncbi:MAG TPA: hypothetical protein VN328_00630 [Thermodesulfovibrionales bacterium]|nr:hypothetical protein [Thermodesulfovibrionales bacterium]